ncbi:MAG: hypothetical protein KDA61_18205, partial [Planctomycetales bacterium]|nr:hypothetical protein [Planctomycetales bacterium]
QRFVEGRPIQARPISRVQRTWRWAKRKPAAALLAALAVGVAVGAPIATLIINHQKEIIAGQLEKSDNDFAALKGQLTTLIKEKQEAVAQLDAIRGANPDAAQFLPGWRRNLASHVIAARGSALRQLADDPLASPLVRAKLELGMGALYVAAEKHAEAVACFAAARTALVERLQSESLSSRDAQQFAETLAECETQLAALHAAAAQPELAAELSSAADKRWREVAQSAEMPTGIDVELLASLLQRTEVADAEQLPSLLNESLQLKNAVIDNWPLDADGVYRAAYRLTQREVHLPKSLEGEATEAGGDHSE